MARKGSSRQRPPGPVPGGNGVRAPDPHDIVDFHLGSRGDFWVCCETECHEGSLDDAVYLLGGKREVEG